MPPHPVGVPRKNAPRGILGPCAGEEHPLGSQRRRCRALAPLVQDLTVPCLALCSAHRSVQRRYPRLSLASVLLPALLAVTTAAAGGCRSTSAGPPTAPPAAAQNDQQKSASAAAHNDSDGKEELEYKPDDPRLRFIKVADVEKGTVGAIAAVTGRIAFDEDHTSRVGSPVSGRVEELLVKPGRSGQKGAALAHHRLARCRRARWRTRARPPPTCRWPNGLWNGAQDFTPNAPSPRRS